MNDQGPLNIALIRRSFDPAKGGAEKVAARFVELFNARGHMVTFYGEKFEAEPHELFHFVKVPKKLLCTSGTAGFHRSVQKVLAPRRREYDVIYSMCRTWPADVFRVTEQLHAEWAPEAYSPLAYLNPRHLGILRLEKACFDPRRVGCVITNSGLVRAQVIKRFHLAPELVEIIPNGVDPEMFYPVSSQEKMLLRDKLKLDKNRTVLFFAAADFKTKKLASAIEALAALNFEHKENMQLVVAGGADSAPYRKQADDSGVRAKFVGKITNMADYYQAADMFYYPGPYEPFANVCLEAAACGLPVLTTRNNGSSEIVAHGKSGYVIDDYRNNMEIRHCIVDFMTRSRGQRLEMSEEIFKIAQLYSWENHADMLEELFYRVKEAKRHEAGSR